MDFQHILTHVEQRVAYLTLNRPEVLNSFNEQMHQEVAQILAEWETSEQIKVIVISGMGKGFCAGQDLSARKPEVIEDHTDSQMAGRVGLLPALQQSEYGILVAGGHHR